MKFLTSKIGLLISLVVFLFSCTDDETPTNPVSTTEAAEMIAASLTEEASGATASMEVSLALIYGLQESDPSGRIATCGYSEDTVFSLSSTPGSMFTYNYDFSYDYSLACNEQNFPSTLSFLISYDGDFESQRFITSSSGIVEWEISGFALTEPNYIFNGSYTRVGSFQSKVRNENSINSTLEYELSDVAINKSTLIIDSGTASVNITGNITGKGWFSFSGTIVFLGNKEASITIGREIYIVNLETGELDQ